MTDADMVRFSKEMPEMPALYRITRTYPIPPSPHLNSINNGALAFCEGEGEYQLIDTKLGN